MHRICLVLLAGLSLNLAARSGAVAQSARIPAGPYTVVVASVPRVAAAEALLARVPNATEALVVKANTRLGIRYRVCLGRFLERPAAERQRLAVQNLFPEAWLLALGDSVLAVEPSKAAPTAPPVSSLEGFLSWYDELLPVLEQMDARRAQRFIDPDLGLWVRHQPGAFAVVQRCSTLSEVLDLAALESSAARAALEACWGAYRSHKPTLIERLPRPCTAAAASDSTDSLVVAPLTESDLTLASSYSAMKAQLVGPQLSSDEAQQLYRVQSLQRYAVVHRRAAPVRALYFALVEGRWALTQLDLLCDPL